MAKVSVIVPIYNVQDYLEKSIQSLINQTLADIEIILVNDGATDKSGEIAKRFKKKYPNKIMYLEKQNGGLSDARNFGIPFASGEYIAFLDSDDYVEENMYEEMYTIAKQENSDMVECDFYWEYPKKTRLDTGAIYTNKHEMIEKVRVVAWNKLIRKKILDETKVKFPKGYRYEDVEFTYKLIPHLNKISFVKKPFIHYIQRQNSISNVQNERTKEIFDVLENVLNYYKKNNLFEEYKAELEYIYVRYLLCSSLKRMTKVEDKKVRESLLNQTWENINNKFPDWKQNDILKTNKSIKNLYLKSVNSKTYKAYCTILRSL